MKRTAVQVGSGFLAGFLFTAGLLLAPQAALAEIFRCAGSPAMYTSDARTARQRGCAPVNETAIRPAPQASAMPITPAVLRAKSSTEPSTAARGDGVLLISSQTQKARDASRYELLRQEMSEEQAKADQLREKLARTAPSNPSHAELRQSLERAQSNLTALQRELQYVRM
jgi:hypothetical protein